MEGFDHQGRFRDGNLSPDVLRFVRHLHGEQGLNRVDAWTIVDQLVVFRTKEKSVPGAPISFIVADIEVPTRALSACPDDVGGNSGNYARLILFSGNA